MSKKANAAIHYDGENYSTSGPKLMGKGSANESFLKAFVKHSDIKDFYCFAHNRKSFDGFGDSANRYLKERKDNKNITFRWIAPDRQHQFSEPGCFYIPAPQIAQYAWTRRAYNQRDYSLCGLTHTISSEGVMGLFEDTIIAPTQEWDAIICTSHVVRKSIANVVDTYSEYMRQRFGGPKFELNIQLPVIPLGVDCEYYKATEDRKKRANALRKELKIAEDAIVFLFVGRLSMHAKAHPTPMYLALEEAAKRTGKKVVLVQSGWFDNDGQKKGFLDGAKTMSPSVMHIIVDGRKPEIRDIIYHACDVFTSLSDNIQETFGLTPLEAMAAGKPVVVTDWNGYRDTVRNGEDGITIPTLAPAPGLSFDLGQRFESRIDNYDHYIGTACQMTSVDVGKCADAYTALINSKDLRNKMGKAGQKRAEQLYDWKHIISSYQELWAELGEIRNSKVNESCKKPQGQPSHPLFNDPFTIFDSYPTAHIKDEDAVCLCGGADEKRFNTIRDLGVNSFCLLISKEDQEAIFRYLQQYDGNTVREIAANFPDEKQSLVKRYLIWFAKVGLVSIGGHNDAQKGQEEQCLEKVSG